MLFPKPMAMKLKEATNNNLKLPLANNSDVHKSMKLIQIDEILPHFLINKMLTSFYFNLINLLHLYKLLIYLV